MARVLGGRRSRRPSVGGAGTHKVAAGAAYPLGSQAAQFVGAAAPLLHHGDGRAMPVRRGRLRRPPPVGAIVAHKVEAAGARPLGSQTAPYIWGAQPPALGRAKPVLGGGEAAPTPGGQADHAESGSLLVEVMKLLLTRLK